jgi:predicted nucleotidyltransferase
MRKMKVDMAELGIAFEDASQMVNHYLDLETGQVIAVTNETHWSLEAIYEEYHDPDSDQPFDLAEVLRQSDMADWQQEMLLDADRVEIGYGTRYIAVPHIDSHEAYRDMEHFIQTVRDTRLQGQLWRAISGRGAFRRFKDVLYDHPGERERWFEFSERQLRQCVLDWLESVGIEPLEEPALGVEPEPAPPLRPRLIAEVLHFVRAACRLPGVTRIALIGSLVTDKADPKDADLLVTVTDDADLAPLATLGRKLQGHTQSFNRGGEVFLANPEGSYLGRTCPWKLCGPGIRASCDALHCGGRPYLHDDFLAVRLPEPLIAEPPLELWPQIVARVPLPEDIEVDLIQPLRAKR